MLDLAVLTLLWFMNLAFDKWHQMSLTTTKKTKPIILGETTDHKILLTTSNLGNLNILGITTERTGFEPVEILVSSV